MRIFSSTIIHFMCSGLLAIAPLAADESQPTFGTMPVENPIEGCGCGHSKDKHPKPPKSSKEACKDCSVGQLCRDCSYEQELCNNCAIDCENKEEYRYLLAGCDNSPEACRECLAALQHRMEEEEELCDDEEPQLEDCPSEAVSDNVSQFFKAMSKLPTVNHQAGYVTSHPGAIHWLAKFGLNIGNTIQLEDFSVWKVKDEEAYIVSEWTTRDQIVIYANFWWRWSYPYIIENVDQGTKVQAKIHEFLDPLFNHTIFHHWIAHKHDHSKVIWLEDGTKWIVDGFDYCPTWKEGQTIILGINNGFRSSDMPNILINANLPGHYVRATCVQ